MFFNYGILISYHSLARSHESRWQDVELAYYFEAIFRQQSSQRKPDTSALTCFTMLLTGFKLGGFVLIMTGYWDGRIFHRQHLETGLLEDDI